MIGVVRSEVKDIVCWCRQVRGEGHCLVSSGQRCRTVIGVVRSEVKDIVWCRQVRGKGHCLVSSGQR